MARGGGTPILGAPEQRPTDEIRAPAEAVSPVDHLSKSFGPHGVLHAVTLDVAPREVLCVIGPSGPARARSSGASPRLRSTIVAAYTSRDSSLGTGRPPAALSVTMRATHARAPR